MKRVKRILAVIGIVLLIAMYVAAFVSAFFKTPQAMALFKASLGATVMVPVVIYAYSLIYRGIVERSIDKRDIEDMDVYEDNEESETD